MSTYQIIRFRYDAPNEVIREGLTLEEAKEHCEDPATSGEGWFDGFQKEDE